MLNVQDKKILEEIFLLFKELEKSVVRPSQSTNFLYSEAPLLELKQRISNLKSSSNPDVQKLGEIEKHLHKKMTLKHFVAFMIPIERILNKNVQDDGFLVLTDDKQATATDSLPLVFILDNIRSAFNVGSILRTAECLNIEKVYLCGYTPNPEQPKLAKTAMGTQDTIAWEAREHIIDLINELKFKGYQVIGLETAEKPVDLYEKFTFAPTALVVGNERFGLDIEVLKSCDEIRKIPLRGRKNSLNVAISLAVAAFEWNRQYGK